MSAFLVSDYHLNALALFASANRVEVRLNNGDTLYAVTHPTKVGGILKLANEESVNYRYNESDLSPPFSYRPVQLHSPVEILKACSCYEYQSCEFPGWEDSDAHKVIAAIRREAIHALPGYDEAPWELNQPTTKARAKQKSAH